MNMPYHFLFNLLTFSIDEKKQWFFGIGELEVNDFDGHLLYVQNYYGWQFEILYCKAFCQVIREWVDNLRRK
jgi:hypothetical protein